MNVDDHPLQPSGTRGPMSEVVVAGIEDARRPVEAAAYRPHSEVRRGERFSTTPEWEPYVEKICNFLAKRDKALYGTLDPEAILEQMKAFPPPDLASVRFHFVSALVALRVRLAAADNDALNAVPDAVLLQKRLPLSIFTYPAKSGMRDKDAHFWKLSALEVLFVGRDALDAHKDRGEPKNVDTSAAQIIAAVHPLEVVVLHGESGSGKTLNAMLSTLEHPTSRKAALCVCVVPEDVGLAVSKDKNELALKEKDPIKNHFLKNFSVALKAKWHELAKADGLLSETATEGHVTVLFDEFGSFRHAVRAICSSRGPLIDATREALHLAPTVTVQIIVAGTGTQGGTHMAGSVPSTYTLLAVRPPLWLNSRPKVVDAQNTAFAVEVCAAVEAGKSRAANAAKRMVSTNARACAIFLKHVSRFGDGNGRMVSPKLLRELVESTAVEFKSLNGLKKIKEREYRELYFQAVALTLYAASEDPFKDSNLDVSLCIRDCGMLTDRAVKVKSDSVNSKTHELIRPIEAGLSLCLPTEYHGQRFYLSDAQIVIAQTLLGLGDRDFSGEGFEVLAADYLVHAAMLAPKLKGKALLKPLLPRGQAAVLPWIHTLQLLQEMTKSAGETDTVIRSRLKHKIEPTPTGGRVENDDNIVKDAPAKNVDAVMINADKSAFADLVFKQGAGLKGTKATVWLVQTKRYDSTTLTPETTMAELFKMGDANGWPWSVTLALKKKEGWRPDEAKWRSDAGIFLEKALSRVSLSGAFAAEAAKPDFWNSLVDRLHTLKPTHSISADKALKTIAGGDCDVKRVVLVWGRVPDAVEHKTSDGTLLVHAWDPASDVLANSPALGGLYPFDVRDADFAELKLTIDRTVRPADPSVAADECYILEMTCAFDMGDT